MHYRIEIVSNRFDKTLPAGLDNVNGFCGKDVVLFVVNSIGIDNYEVLNEDWGRGIYKKSDAGILEVTVSDLRPGEPSFGQASPLDGPSWRIIITTKVASKSFLFLTTFLADRGCEVIGTQLKDAFLRNGDSVVFSGMESA